MAKKVLMLCPFYPPNIGGAETFAEGLAKEISKYHSLYILAYQPFEGNESIITRHWFNSSNYADVERMTWQFKPNKAWKGTGIKNLLTVLPKMSFRAGELQAKFNFDIVLCNGLISSVIGANLKDKTGCKYLSILLALYDFKGKKGLFPALAKRTLRKADCIFVEGVTGFNDILNLGLNRVKIKIFQHWTDWNRFYPKERTNAKLKVLFIGRPIKEKGIHIIKEVEKRRNLNVEFIYVENVSYENLASYYQMADVLCVPSLYSEGFSRVVAEGATCGCALVVSNKGALPEMIGDRGIVIEPTADNFERALKKLVFDLEYRKQFQKLAIELANDKFSIDNADIFLDEL